MRAARADRKSVLKLNYQDITTQPSPHGKALILLGELLHGHGIRQTLHGVTGGLGYNNRYENLALDPEAPAQLKRYGAPDYMTGRQLYIKLSYLRRF